jgi:ABC-type multidrug transport system ATPase subunit
MSNILQLVLVLLFDSYKPFFIAMRCLYILGAWMLLKKSGLPAFWSLVPWVREYQLGRSAGREPEGRSFCVTSMLITVLQLANICFRWNRDSRTLSAFVPLILVFLFSVMLMHFVFNIRVFAGFVQIYGVSRAWLILCIFDELRFLPMLIWGLSRKYQPAWKVENLKEEMERLAARGSAGILDEGLTVNLKDRHVKEFFHKKYLLKDIHMAIPQGHMVLLLGGSGAGKTTFLNAVNGYEKADAKVSLNGKDMYSDYKKMQYEVGFVPQQELVRGKDTVEKTLLDTARLRLSKDIPKEARRKRVEEVMEIFGLTPLKDSLVEKLSGGQKKRLSISMEILSNPSLFILDEPDSGLDGVMARELFLELRRIADTGKIVIVITHTPDRVIDLFDDVIVLAKDSSRTGRLAFYGSVADAREFFGRQTMEQIVKSINQKEEGGDGLADEYVLKYAEVQNG